MEPRSNYYSTISTVGLLNLSSVGEEGISFLWELLASYRSAYGMTSAEFLLPRLGGLVPVLLDMERSGSPSPFKTRITSLLGQAAVMAGVLALMGDMISLRRMTTTSSPRLLARHPRMVIFSSMHKDR
jgi:hypothetical protein